MMHHLSASQFKTWGLCPRKWYLEKVEGMRSPTSPAAQLGTDVHNLVEAYLRHGTVIPDSKAGRIACAVLPLIDPAAEPEVGFELPFVEGVPVVGRIDLIQPGTVEDIKTTSDVVRYGKNEMELAIDPQCISYLWASHEDPKLPACNTFSHLYVQTRGVHKTERVSVTLTDDEIAQGAARLKEQAKLMIQHSQAERKSVPANTSACDAYGGCHLRSTCLLDGVFTPKKERDNEMSNFLEMLAKKRKEVNQDEAAPEPIETPAVEAPPEPSTPEPVEPVETAAPEPEPMPPVEDLASGPINPPDGLPDSEEPEAPTKRRGRPSKFPAVPEQFGGDNLGRMKRLDMVALYVHLKASVTANGDIKALYTHLDFDPTAKVGGKNIPAGEIRERLSAFVKAIPADLEPVHVDARTLFPGGPARHRRDESPAALVIDAATNPAIKPRVTDMAQWHQRLDADGVSPRLYLCEACSSVFGGAAPDADFDIRRIDPENCEAADHDEIIAAQAPDVSRSISATPVTIKEVTERVGASGIVLTSTEGHSVTLTPDDDPEPTPQTNGSRTLYVGCRPRLSAPTHLDAVLQKLRDQLTEARGRHWLCISDYGVTGSKLIAEALAQLDPGDLPPEIYADSRIPGHDEAIAVLANTYNVIERG